MIGYLSSINLQRLQGWRATSGNIQNRVLDAWRQKPWLADDKSWHAGFPFCACWVWWYFLWHRFLFLFLPPANEVLGKVIFLHLSVILFTGGWYPSMHCRWYPSMPRSRSLGGSGIPACLAGFQAHTQGEVEGDLAGEVSRPTPRGAIPACTEADPPDGYCCGWYASYWNAFLLMITCLFV